MQNLETKTLQQLIDKLLSVNKFKKKVIMIRHGESYGNVGKQFHGQLDFELTQNGIKQAKDRQPVLSAYLDRIDYIKCSSLVRSIQTMQNMLDLDSNKEIHEKIEYDHKIKEMNYGVLEGAYRDYNEVPRTELIGLLHMLYTGTFIPLGSEGKGFGKRIRESLSESQNGFGVYFTHSGVIYNLTHEILGKTYIKNCGAVAFAFDEYEKEVELIGYYIGG